MTFWAYQCIRRVRKDIHKETMEGDLFERGREDGNRERRPGTQGQGRGKDRVMSSLQRKARIPKEIAMGIFSVAERSVTKLRELPSPEPPTAGKGDPSARRVRGLLILRPQQAQV